MASPIPKPAGTRQRRNKASTARTLAVVTAPEPAPELPESTPDWHPQTRDWWAEVWASPMAPEYDRSDLGGLFLLARLVDAAWRAESVTALKEAMTEVRLQRAEFGLTPIARRRLQWEIDRGESADAKTRKRRATANPKPEAVEEDSRRLLA